MDKFWKFQDGFIWERDGLHAYVDDINGEVSFNVVTGFDRTPCTREEFTAAAMQAIEKLKAQGIDIGTEWLPKWEPKVGELVCAWDNYNRDGFIVAKFVSQSDGIFPYTLSNGYAYEYIAPFTGEIPEPFKSRWEAEGDDPS
jgi:hypothetical protein